ncbi:MAG: hypothetical protein OXL37_13735 [Chloroflexota bacterium]|nr:hypothetical protein [Chloroflexota bacterium]MDE2961809.1 hypothetical protein [Chloroflexota bacterium]
MKTFLLISVIVYVILTIGGAAAALTATIEIYTFWERELPEILTAAIINTAAIFAATSFIGVLDMFMTLWTLLKSKDWEEEARKEREADRQAREKELAENRQARAAEQAAREKEIEENRKLRQAELQAREKELEISRQARAAEQQAREKEFAANHQLREAELQARLQSMEAERLAREQSVRENRDFQQRILDELAADRAAQAQMTSRVMDLLEQMSHRLNGDSGRGRPE